MSPTNPVLWTEFLQGTGRFGEAALGPNVHKATLQLPPWPLPAQRGEERRRTMRDVDVWLPHCASLRIGRELEAWPRGAVVLPALSLENERRPRHPRWVVYGSSITHGAQASRSG